MAERGPVLVRSYRTVLDDVERRIYRIDRWRLPLPGGIELRAIVYALAAFAPLAVLGSLPLAGVALETLPPGIRYLALPVALGFGLAAWRIDGRAPHRALAAAARFAASPRSLAGLRRAPRAGTLVAPLAGLQVAPAGDEPAYRPGRVRGPAEVTLRYPARLALEGARGRARAGEVRGLGSGGRPLRRGRTLRIPAGSEVRFR